MAAPPGDLAMLLLGDARLPTGGHTQSAGLEGALAAGLHLGDIPAYIDMRLRTVATVDAGTAVTARAVLSGTSPASIESVQRHWAARTPSQVQRAASVRLGRGCLRLLQSMFPAEGPTRLLGAVRAPSRPLVLGGLAAVLGLDGRRLATVVCYDEVQSIAAAALKLVPLDPVVTAGWVLGAARAVEGVVTRVAHLVDPGDLPAPSAPLMDLWAHAHAAQPGRLFSA